MRQEITARRPFEGRQAGRDGLFLTGNRIIRANTSADEAREGEGGKTSLLKILAEERARRERIRLTSEFVERSVDA